MNFGAPTPIEVAVSGPNLAANRAFADKVLAEMKKIPSLRDLQFGQPLDYPTVDIKIDRKRAGQLGVTVEQIGALARRGDFVEPLHTAGLLARPGQRHGLSGAGRNPAVADGFDRRRARASP